MIAVSAQGVVKRFGDTTALHEVTLSVPRGAVLALVGPNGAGKTTLVSLITGTRTPDIGRVELFGGNPRDWRFRRRVGVVPQEIGFLPCLRVREIVDLVRVHYDEPASTGALLARFGLAGDAAADVARLSSGQRRRLAVALAFVGRPDLLVLDEPTAGLDLQARRGLWQELRAHIGAGGSILLTTHYLEEVEALAHQVVVLFRGRVLAAGSVGDVKASAAQMRRVLADPGGGVGTISLEDAVTRLIEAAQ